MKKTLVLIAFLFFTNFLTLANNNYYFVFLNTNPDREELPKEEIQELQNRHLANIDSLYKTGKLVAAGPFEGGGGIFILVAPTLDSAKNILKSDPAIAAKRFETEVFAFNFHIGNTCTIQEPFEMATYNFIRYFKGIVDISQEKYDSLYMKHLDLYATYSDSMILDGSFHINDGFIQIINIQDSEKIKDIIRQDSLVNQNYYYTEIKKLWIANGTFCKK